MKNKFIPAGPAGLLAAGLIAATALFLNSNAAVEPANTSNSAYEYVAVRFMGGDKACIIWPDGKSERLNDLVQAKRPSFADERMFLLCIAINLLSKRGFEPATIPSVQAHPDDLWMRRLTSPGK